VGGTNRAQGVVIQGSLGQCAPLPFSPTLLGRGVRVPPSSYTKRPQGRRRTHNCKELGALLSSSMHPLSLSLALPLVWLPEGLRKSEDYSTAAHHHAEGIQHLIQIDLLPQYQLDRRSRKKSSFIVCVQVLRGAALCGTKSLHWCSRNIRIYTTLRLATSASSSNLVRERNPAFGLRGYVTKSQLIIIALLIHRSWEFGFHAARIFLFLASIPNTWATHCQCAWLTTETWLPKAEAIVTIARGHD
jgi:hypothetical protein